MSIPHSVTTHVPAVLQGETHPTRRDGSSVAPAFTISLHRGTLATQVPHRLQASPIQPYYPSFNGALGADLIAQAAADTFIFFRTDSRTLCTPPLTVLLRFATATHRCFFSGPSDVGSCLWDRESRSSSQWSRSLPYQPDFPAGPGLQCPRQGVSFSLLLADREGQGRALMSFKLWR